MAGAQVTELRKSVTGLRLEEVALGPCVTPWQDVGGREVRLARMYEGGPGLVLSGSAPRSTVTEASLAQFLVPEKRFDQVNVDLVGPLPHPVGSHTSSQWETAPLAGQKLFRCHLNRWMRWFGLLFGPGSPGSEPQCSGKKPVCDAPSNNGLPPAG